MYWSVRSNPIGYTTVLVLFVIQQCCIGSVHRVLKHYEVLNYDTTNLADHHKRTRRSVPDVESIEHMELQILAFGKNLTLILNHDYDVIHSTARLTIGGIEHPGGLSSYADHMVRGVAANYPNSGVFGSILNGVFRGTILLDHLHPDPKLAMMSDSYFIEPAGYYFEEVTEFHSIIYHSSHVREPEQHFQTYNEIFDHPSHFCGLSNPEVLRKMESLTSPTPDVSNVPFRRVKRSADTQPSDSSSQPSDQPIDGYSRAHFAYMKSSADKSTASKKRVCNLLLQSDTFLWDRVMTFQHVNGDRDLATKEITSIFTQHVQSAQTIFTSHVFRDHAGQFEFAGVGFRVDHVVINMTDVHCKQRSSISKRQVVAPDRSSTQETYADENPFCTENIDVTNMLDLFSHGNYDEFCAAYVFTYRDFANGVLGLAFVGSPNHIGGICTKNQLISGGSRNVYKSLNTGLVTLKNYAKQVSTKVTQVTFAHELGHNFGCQHDDSYKNEPYGCLPDVNDPRGNFIMFSSATSGDKQNNNKFSRCSSDSIAKLLHYLKSTGNKDCFLDSQGPFCGNKLVEADEQCDCGYSRASCTDQCCNPRESESPCKLTDVITVNGSPLQVRCSVTAGECCTHNCQFQNTNHVCRSASECYEASYCTGESAECPASKILPDGTLCQDSSRVCKNGQCTGSLCESIPGWVECSSPRDESVTPEMLCYVSCREDKVGAPCINTFTLQQDKALQAQYPQLTSKLLRKGFAVQMQPGTPCDNYMGYCDAFHRCMSIETSGPLTRLRNLLFSPQMLDKVRSWITVHWWAVILMCLGAIIGMMLFVKFCARHTPMAQSRYPHRARSLAHLHSQRRGADGPSRAHRERHAARASHDAAPLPARVGDDRWAWPEQKRPGRNRRRRKKSEQPVAVGVVPSAPPLEMDDLAPPPNARRKPLPIHNSKNNNAHVTPSAPLTVEDTEREVELTSVHIPQSLSRPVSTHIAGARSVSSIPTDSTEVTEETQNTAVTPACTPRSSSGHGRRSNKPRSRSRPMSMFAHSANIVGPASMQAGEPHRQRVKVRRPRSNRSPLQQPFLPHPLISTVINEVDLPEDHFLPSSAYTPFQSSSHAQPPTRLRAVTEGNENAFISGERNSKLSADSSVPPPAYDDLPFHKPVMYRRRSSPPNRV